MNRSVAGKNSLQVKIMVLQLDFSFFVFVFIIMYTTYKEIRNQTKVNPFDQKFILPCNWFT